VDLRDNPVAIFGSGDSLGCGDSLCDGIEEFDETFAPAGAEMVGYVDPSEYQQSDTRSGRPRPEASADPGPRTLVPYVVAVAIRDSLEASRGRPIDERADLAMEAVFHFVDPEEEALAAITCIQFYM